MKEVTVNQIIQCLRPEYVDMQRKVNSLEEDIKLTKGYFDIDFDLMNFDNKTNIMYSAYKLKPGVLNRIIPSIEKTNGEVEYINDKYTINTNGIHVLEEDAFNDKTYEILNSEFAKKITFSSDLIKYKDDKFCLYTYPNRIKLLLTESESVLTYDAMEDSYKFISYTNKDVSLEELLGLTIQMDTLPDYHIKKLRKVLK